MPPESEPTPIPAPEPAPTPPAPPATPPAGPSPFAQLMGEELAALPSIQKFEENEDPARAMGKSYVELQGMLGGDKIVLPKNGAPPEEWDRVHKALGRPDDPSGYDFSKLAPPEGLPWDDGIALQMIHSLHKSGANQAQIETVIGDYMQAQQTSYGGFVERATQAKAETVKALQTEWGAKYDENKSTAEAAFRAVAGENADDIAEMMLGDGTMIGDHPLFTALFFEFSKGLAEHNLIGAKAPGGLVKSQGAATAELAQMHGDPEQMKILMDSQHPEHKAMQDKMTALQKTAYPGGK